MATKKEITKRIKLQANVEKNLRKLKVLTAFKRNMINYFYHIWHRIGKMAGNEVADSSLSSKIESINAEQGLNEIVNMAFYWSGTPEGRVFWHEISQKQFKSSSKWTKRQLRKKNCLVF